MAIGDPVNVTGLLGFTYQPAVGVSVMVSGFFCPNSNGYITGVGDLNTNTDAVYYSDNNGGGTYELKIVNSLTSVKYFITNTGYLTTVATSRYIAMTGIQIQ